MNDKYYRQRLGCKAVVEIVEYLPNMCRSPHHNQPTNQPKEFIQTALNDTFSLRENNGCFGKK